MASEKITRIRIGPAMVDLVGLKEAIDELGPALGGREIRKSPNPYYRVWRKKIILPKRPGTNTAKPWSENSNEVWVWK